MLSQINHGSWRHAEWLEHPDFARFAPDAERGARAILERHEPKSHDSAIKHPAHRSTVYATLRVGGLWFCKESEALADAISAWIETPNPEGE